MVWDGASYFLCKDTNSIMESPLTESSHWGEGVWLWSMGRRCVVMVHGEGCSLKSQEHWTHSAVEQLVWNVFGPECPQHQYTRNKNRKGVWQCRGA